ncbi:MAG: alpha/beta fold hydrolase [Microthrixaceae bacterium]
MKSGVTLVADHWGTPSEKAVLFLHGGGQTRHSWGGTARAIAEEGAYAITLDLRGHGDSDWNEEGSYQLWVFADDAAEVIGQVGVRPTLVGASLGGMTGVMLEGERHPGSVGALILVDVVPRMDQRGADRVKDFMLANARSGFGSLGEAADAIAAYNPHRPRPNDLEGLKKNLRERDGRWYWHWDPRVIELGASEPLREVRDPERLTAALKSTDVPLMLVRGRMSDLVTAEGARGFLDEFPDARFVDVSGAGHMVAGDKNDIFTAAVMDFLATL